MTAKLEAHLAEVAQAERAHASAARTPTRPISIHLTPFAPELRKHAISDRKRWVTLYGNTPMQATRKLLTRLRLRPEAVRTATLASGDVDVLAPVPSDLLDTVSAMPGERVPWATIWDGVSEPELQDVLAQLTAARWAPATASELFQDPTP